jgi:hypothetical protein
MTIWNRIKNLFSQSGQTMDESGNTASSEAEATLLSQEILVDLMQRIEKTAENAYCCEEVFALLDEYVELVDEEEAKRVMPLVKNHLDMCQDCQDEYEILRHVVNTAD